MRLFGYDLSITKSTLSPVPDNRGWWPVIRESFTGAWQRNITVNMETALSFHATFACQTLIASDIAKLRVKLVAQDGNGIWTETKNPAYSPVLRKPNAYQNRIQFFENWVLSKLQRGNAYVLKRRDGRGVVVGLHVLDPTLVRPLVSDEGEVFYELRADNLSGVNETVYVPAREIIHDRFNCFFHPLVGLSPIFAGGLAATQGLKIQNYSANFFENGARPSGVLTAPGLINKDTIERLAATWQDKYAGADNAGKLVVLGDGLKYDSMAFNSVDAQLIEQLKWSAEVVCSTYHVPPYKIGIGQQPTYNNVQALNTEYYSQCLQVLIEAIELCLDEGLATGEALGTEFDIDNLLRMDGVTQMEMLDKSKGKMTVNEQRFALNKKPVEGGDTVYLQEQDHSLEWLSRRDAMPMETVEPAANDDEPTDAERAEQRAGRKALLEKRIRERVNA